MFQEGPKTCGPGFGVCTIISLCLQHLRTRAPTGCMDGGSRPALPGLHDVLCHSPCSDSFELHVAFVEPSAKTLEFGV